MNKTTDKLKLAFIEIYKTKPVNAMSIKEITTLAGMTRGTFYIYYQNIYDLLSEIENEIISDLRKIADKFFHQSTTNDADIINDMVYPFFDYIRKNHNYFSALLGEYSLPTFSNEFMQLMKDDLLKKFQMEGRNLGYYQDYALEYFASANLGLINYWLKTEMKLSTEELLKLITKILCFGIFNL